MTSRTFKSELDSLLFAFSTKSNALNHPLANKVKEDFNQALNWYRTEKKRRCLIWGLLIGRSVDSFTLFFLHAKGAPSRGKFDDRIKRICRQQNPLTTDLTIRTDLDTVRLLRNSLFHEAGRHFNETEMQSFLFKSVRCLQQLIRDL
jgi:hypothetical protein